MEVGGEHNHWGWALLVVAIYASFVGASFIVANIPLLRSLLGG